MRRVLPWLLVAACGCDDGPADEALDFNRPPDAAADGAVGPDGTAVLPDANVVA